MEKDEFINKNYYFGFGTYVKDIEAGEIVHGNQTIFGNKVFDILRHDKDMETLREFRGDTFDSTHQKIYYFEMIETAYKVHTPQGYQGIIKYEILRIIS